MWLESRSRNPEIEIFPCTVMYSYFKLANDEFGAPRQCPRHHRASPRPLGGKSQMGLLLQTHVGVLRIVFGHLAHLWPQKSAHPNSRANISILKGKQATRCQEHVWTAVRVRGTPKESTGVGLNECCQWGGVVCKKSARHYPLLLDVDESWSDKSSGSPKLELATAVRGSVQSVKRSARGKATSWSVLVLRGRSPDLDMGDSKHDGRTGYGFWMVLDKKIMETPSSGLVAEPKNDLCILKIMISHFILFSLIFFNVHLWSSVNNMQFSGPPAAKPSPNAGVWSGKQLGTQRNQTVHCRLRFGPRRSWQFDINVCNM